MEQNNELVRVINESGVEQSTALTLQSSFLPFFEQAEQWKIKAESLVVTDASQTREMKMAREARLALKDIRVSADKTRKALKEDSLRYGKAVQGVYNVIDYLIAPIEKHLEEQEKFPEIQEKKRKAALKEERDAELLPYIEFVPYQVDLGELTEAAWQTVINGAKLQKQAKITAEIEAEAARIAKEKADAEERERIRLENERLKKEAEEKEAALKAEREKAESDRKALEEQHRKESAERERLAAIEKAKTEAEWAKAEKLRIAAEKKAADELAKAKALAKFEQEKAEAIRIEAEKKAADELAKEKAASAKIAEQLRLKQEAEQAERDRLAKIESDRIAAEKKAAKAPEKEQLMVWLKEIKMTVPMPITKTKEAQDIAVEITTKFSAFKKWAISQIETL